jgi:hypothetical protein
MQTMTLRAHFDGKQILLDEPYELEPNTRLLITVVPDQMISDEHEEWLVLSKRGLANAYDEEEAEYTQDMIKRMNPDYERR